MVLANDNAKREIQTTKSPIVEKHLISEQIPSERRQEILEYLKLFGYKPDRTIIQVHIAGFFNKKQPHTGKEAEKRQATAKKYGGTTFVIVGRNHDPSIGTCNKTAEKKVGPYESRLRRISVEEQGSW